MLCDGQFDCFCVPRTFHHLFITVSSYLNLSINLRKEYKPVPKNVIFMKWTILLLVLLISCAPVSQEVSSKPVIAQQPEAPKAQPVLEPVKAPVVPPVQPAPQPAAQPAPKLSPKEECNEMCQENCKATAQNSCTQKERSSCKDICGNNPTVDPSACTQACTYLSQPNQCKLQMEQFCSANCVRQCS